MTARNTCSDLDLADLAGWKEELAVLNTGIRTELAALTPLLQNLTSGVVAATATFVGTGQHLVLTWGITGEEGNSWSVMLLIPPPTTVDITADVNVVNKFIIIYLQSTTGVATTTASALATWINSDPTVSSYMSAAVPAVPDLLLVPDYQQFQGGNSAPLTTVTNLLKTVFSAAGITPQEALQRVGRASTADANMLESIAGIMLLTPPAAVRVDGTNLVNIRSLWTFLGANAGATTRLLTFLAMDVGTPIVVWVETIITVVDGSACAPAAVTTATNNVLAINAKTTNTNAVPHTYWLESIQINAGTLAKLNRYGVVGNNLITAMSEGTTTFVIEMKTVLDQFVSADQNLLLGLETAGIISITYDTAIDAITKTPFGKTSSFVPQLQIPSNSIKLGINPIDPVTGLNTTGTMILAVEESFCLGAKQKGQITAFISCISAAFDFGAQTLQAILDKARIPIDKVSEVLDVINTFLYGRIGQASSCILGLDLIGVIGDIDLLIPTLPFLSDKLSIVLDKIVAVLDYIIPDFCKIQKALQNLMHIDDDPALRCLSIAITDDLFNLLGIKIMKLPICIENPLGVVGMLAALGGKVDKMISMIQGFLNNIILLKNSLAALAKYFDDEIFKEYTSKCESNSLNALSKRIKSSFI